VRGRHQCVDVFYVAGQALRFVANPAIPRQTEYLGHPGRLAQLPRQRVLSSSAAYNQNFHKKKVTVEDIKTKQSKVNVTAQRDFVLLQGEA
jgi:hypothetical protein